MPRSPVAQWLLLLAGTLALSTLLHLARMPGALLLGPMLVAIAFGLRGASVRLPGVAFTGAQGILGALVAHAITPAILLTIGRDWPAMLLAVGLTILSASAVSWALARWTSLPGSVAAWGLSPGAASAMISLAEENGSDPRIVAFMQYLRAVCVVLSASLVTLMLAGPRQTGAAAPAPAAALDASGGPVELAGTLALAFGGAWIGRRLRLPSGGLLGPMLIGAALHATGLLAIALPSWLLTAAYVGIGWTVGLRFTPDALRLTIRTIPQILVATVAMIGLGAGSAWVLARSLGIDFLTAFLATSPGGLDAVAILTVGQPVDVPFILALQTLRLFLVILTGPFVARLVARSTARPG